MYYVSLPFLDYPPVEAAEGQGTGGTNGYCEGLVKGMHQFTVLFLLLGARTTGLVFAAVVPRE